MTKQWTRIVIGADRCQVCGLEPIDDSTTHLCRQCMAAAVNAAISQIERGKAATLEIRVDDAIDPDTIKTPPLTKRRQRRTHG